MPELQALALVVAGFVGLGLYQLSQPAQSWQLDGGTVPGASSIRCRRRLRPTRTTSPTSPG